MPSSLIERFTNTYSSPLTAAPGVAGTTLTVGSTVGLSASSTAVPPRITRLLVGTEVIVVTDVPSATTLTVTRGAEGSTAAAHAVGTLVRQVTTSQGLHNLAAPGGNDVALGAATTYVPDVAVKYHILRLGTAAISVGVPTTSLPTGLQIGTELRFIFVQGATGRAVTFPAATFAVNGFAVSTTANAVSSGSFVYVGAGALPAPWVRVQ